MKEIKDVNIYIAELRIENKMLLKEVKFLRSLLIKDPEKKKCCEFCIKKDTSKCPIKDAKPWSVWKNYCNKYEREND